MKTLIFDVPASSGGALSVLNMYYQQAITDAENNYIFVVSVPKLTEQNNIKVLRYPNVKKSWLHRYYFDKFIEKKIIKETKPDKIISLQNIAIKANGIYQELYMHQSLPFIKIKFSFIKHFKLWVYQNIIGKKIKQSFDKVDKIIVQTKWIRDAIFEQTKTDINKIIVEMPNVDKSLLIQNKQEKTASTFFYPASPMFYKNHSVIIEAAKILSAKKIDYKFIFTVDGSENKYIAELKKQAGKSKLNIEWLGAISQEEVYKFYSRTNLIFPSYVETFGLPLLEARLSNAPILASDMEFSREICEGYDKVAYFQYNDYKQLADIIRTKYACNK